MVGRAEGITTEDSPRRHGDHGGPSTDSPGPPRLRFISVVPSERRLLLALLFAPEERGVGIRAAVDRTGVGRRSLAQELVAKVVHRVGDVDVTAIVRVRRLQAVGGPRA